ncbi:E3 SUMO-protein ligase ZBED1 [Diretmus argenteus]
MALNLNLVPKKNVTSPIWEYLGFKPDAKGKPMDATQAICKICRRVVPVKESQTTNLHVHLRAHHPADAAKLAPRDAAVGKDSSQPSIIGAFAKSTKYKRTSERWAQCTTAVSKYIAKEMVSYHTVEKAHFKELLQTFDKQYELPGRKYFTKTAIPDLYMCVTAHYISEDWKLEAKCLETTFIPENHTAEVLAEALTEAMHDWDIEDSKISCVTTDNGANIVAAIRELKWPWLNCFGHNLNLAVNNSLQKEKVKTDRAFGVCRSINGAFAHSWQRRREFSKVQEQLNLPQHKLITHMKDVLKEEETDVKITAGIKRGILEKLDSKYDEVTLQLMRKATLLDPRCKGDHIDAPHLDVIKSQLEVEMVAYCKAKTKPPPVRIRVEEEEEEKEKAGAAAEKRTNTLGRLLGRAKQPTATIPAEQRAKSQITSYLQEDVIDGGDTPLGWWRENGSRFPLLANMARKYLCVTTTSSPSERVFSVAGTIVTPHRNLLKPERVNQLIFLAKNL